MSNLEDPRDTQAQFAAYTTIPDPLLRLAVRREQGTPLRRDRVAYLLNRAGLRPSQQHPGRFDLARGYPRWLPPTTEPGYWLVQVTAWTVAATWRGDEVHRVELRRRLANMRRLLEAAGLTVKPSGDDLLVKAPVNPTQEVNP